jgi:hypothetical protein
MTSLHHHRTSSGQHKSRSHSTQPHQIIRRGILTSFSPTTYTANILLIEATSAYLQGIPVACHLDGTSAQVNAMCAVLFFDEQNYTDAVVLAVYPNGSQGIPVPTPGRVVLTAGAALFTSQFITSGSVATFTATGGNIPGGALGIIFSANFTSSSAGSYIQIAPHGAANIGNYVVIGNLPATNAFLNGGGLVQLDSSGKIDIKANGGNCTVSLYTQGYVI